MCIRNPSVSSYVQFLFPPDIFDSFPEIALYPVHDCDSSAHLTSVRTRPDPCLLWAVGVDTVPHTHNSRTLRQEIVDGKSDLGDRIGRCFDHCNDIDVLGSPRASAIAPVSFVYLSSFGRALFGVIYVI
jgi:hypothetical protein